MRDGGAYGTTTAANRSYIQVRLAPGTHSEKKKCYPSSAFFSATSPESEKESEREREREGALLGTFLTGGLGRRLRTDF